MTLKEIIILLSSLPGIGRVTISRFVNEIKFTISQSSEVIDALVELKQSYPRIRIPTYSELDGALFKLDSIQKKCESLDISLITFNDKNYPSRYLRIKDKPLLLYYRGSIDSLNTSNTIAIIGTRKPTEYGLRIGRRIAQVFGELGYVIISGLAIGCDTVAHQGALDTKASTIGVMPCGLDSIYPKSNTSLADRILVNKGGLISEYAPGTTPQKSYYIERNRLQSALGDGLIVVETDVKGGSMQTVKFAIQQKKLIGCIDGHPESLIDAKSIKGNQLLIKDNNAIPITDRKSINVFIDRVNNKLDPYDCDQIQFDF